MVQTAQGALSELERFPRWMWRNRDVLACVTWLPDRNQAQPEVRRVGFYWLELMKPGL